MLWHGVFAHHLYLKQHVPWTKAKLTSSRNLFTMVDFITIHVYLLLFNLCNYHHLGKTSYGPYTCTNEITNSIMYHIWCTSYMDIFHERRVAIFVCVACILSNHHIPNYNFVPKSMAIEKTSINNDEMSCYG
jgi:hypothetical protein